MWGHKAPNEQVMTFGINSVSEGGGDFFCQITVDDDSGCPEPNAIQLHVRYSVDWDTRHTWSIEVIECLFHAIDEETGERPIGGIVYLSSDANPTQQSFIVEWIIKPMCERQYAAYLKDNEDYVP